MPITWSNAQIATWLWRRMGSPTRLIRQVVQATLTDPKYLYLPPGTRPKVAAYLAGDPQHLYGCRLALPGGRTWVLAFDFDHTGHAPPLEAAQALAAAGACPIYWERAEGGHLELYFERPVMADLARTWAVGVAPALHASHEAYPASGQGEDWRDCRHQALSWPLLRLAGAQVVSCPMHAFAPAERWYSPGWLVEPKQVTIRLALAACTTPNALVPDTQMDAPPPVPRPSFSASAPYQSRRAPRQSQDLVKTALAWWKANHTEEDVFAGVAVEWQGDYFKVRDERTASARRDRDDYHEPMYTDFGTGEKLDLFELYCRLRRLNKRQELWRVVDAYLIAHGKRPLKRKF